MSATFEALSCNSLDVHLLEANPTGLLDTCQYIKVGNVIRLEAKIKNLMQTPGFSSLGELMSLSIKRQKKNLERKQKNLLGEVKEDISDTFIDMLPLLFPTFVKQSLKHSILALGQDFDDYYFVTLAKLTNLRVLHLNYSNFVSQQLFRPCKVT